MTRPSLGHGTGANTPVKTLIDMTQVGTLIKCYDSVAAAQAALG